MALAQCSTRCSTSAAAPRVVRSIQLAPSTASSSGRAAVVARAASTKEQEAQARWTQQVKDGIVMNVSNKTAGMYGRCVYMALSLSRGQLQS